MVLTSRWPRMNWSYPTFLVERHFCPWHASLWLPVTCAQVNDEPIRWLQSLLQLERRHCNNKPVEMWFRSSKAIESCKELAEESYSEIAQTWMSVTGPEGIHIAEDVTDSRTIQVGVQITMMEAAGSTEGQADAPHNPAAIYTKLVPCKTPFCLALLLFILCQRAQRYISRRLFL